MAQPGAYDPEGFCAQKLRTIWPFDPALAARHIRAVMAQRGSTSVKNGQSAAADPLIALVRLLARQAAAEFAARATAPAETSNLKTEDRE